MAPLRPRFSIAFAAALIMIATVGCGADRGGRGVTTPNDRDAGGSGAPRDGGTGSTTQDAGQPQAGAPHTPALGCKTGYAACGDVCANLTDDWRHCGGCDSMCDFTEGCVASRCVEGGGCAEPGAHLSCGDTCIATYGDADQCGACENRCGDAQLCVDVACVDGGGNGLACSTPLFWDVSNYEIAGFRMAPALSGPHVFSCGPLQAVQTRWFRFTATKSNVGVQVLGLPDDYILEVYSSSACDESARLACIDNASNSDNPEVRINTTAGTTFHFGVGVLGTWSGSPAQIKIDK